jgi:hypothetical protein
MPFGIGSLCLRPKFHGKAFPQPMAKKFTTYLRKSAKILLWIVGVIIGLFLLIVLLLQLPPVQNFAKNRAVSYIEGKIKTPVSIDKIEIGLPKKVIISGFYFESREKDTLLAGQKLSVDISLFKLLKNQVEINSVSLKGGVATITRTKDSIFNFDYIIDAFASKDPKAKESEPMKISVSRINLDDVRVKYNDAVTKNNVRVNLQHFDTNFKKFDLDGMDFDIPGIHLDGLSLMLDRGLAEQIAKTSVKVVDTISKRPDFKLKLGEIELTRINIGYDNAGTKLNTGLKLGKLLMTFNEIDMNRQSISLKKLEVKNVKGNLLFGKYDQKIDVPEIDTTAIKQKGWRLRLNQADIANIDFKFDDENYRRQPRGIDYKHLDVKNFNLTGDTFLYAEDTVSGNIASFTVIDKSGLNVETLRTNFFYGTKGAYLKDLYLKTPRTLLKDDISVSYPSVKSLSKNPGALSVNASIKNSRVSFKDILIIVPQLASVDPFKSNPNATLLINTRLYGKISDIRFPELELSGIGDTRISARGRIIGLPNAEKANYDVTINNFRSTARDVNSFLPAGTIPKNISLPPVFAASGTFKGMVKNFKTNLNIVSSYGNAKIKGGFDQRFKGREKYDGDIALTEFNIGKLLTNDSLGKISLRAKVNGTGLNPKTANATVKAVLEHAQFNHYDYRNLVVDGEIKNGNFNATAGMKDPNLTFNLAAGGGFNDKYPSAQVKLNVDIADLEKLNLHAGPLKLKGNVDADIQTADLDYLNGTISLSHMQFLAENDPVILDSISLVATATPEKNTMVLKSQFVKANVEGKYKLTQLATALQNSIAKYFDTKPGIPKKKTDPQQLAFEINVDNDPALMQLFPQIKGLEPMKFTGRYNSENDTIVVNADIPKLVYGSNTISGTSLKVDTKDGALVYNADINAIQSSQFMMHNAALSGDIKDDTVAYNLKLKDKNNKEQYVIAGNMKTANGNTEIRIDPEALKLNYESWTISPDNVIRFGKDGIYADNFELSNKGNILKIQSQSSAPNSPLEVTFTDFSLENIMNIVKKDDLLLGGTLNGHVELMDLKTNPVFTSDLTINHFNFKGEEVGDVTIKVDNRTADTFTANVELTGNGNQVTLDGLYHSTSQSFDLDLDIQHLEINSVQLFTFDNIKEGSGFLSGNFKIGGTVEKPSVIGQLKFNDVAFRVTQLNSYFKDIDETVVFTEQGFTLDKFTVTDQKNNELIVNGSVLTTDYKNFGFDLTADADNFRAVNSKPKDNDLYYGDLFLDAKLVIKGTVESPAVSGNVKINEDTKFTVVLPQSDPAITEREGIVEFVDEDNVLLEQTAIMKNELDKSDVKGMDVSVNIQTDKKALLSLIIDKGNGDYLNLKGEADLTGGIDPSGKTTLTGKYEFTEGEYEMTFNLLKRKFEIKSGSYIIWNGEPTTAEINITAIYKVDAAPIDLVGDQLGGVSNAVRSTYKQKIPFQTLLKMDGELLKPQITFDIQLPDGNYNVSSEIVSTTQTKLEQLRDNPAELNKQVFALLLLNRFIGENPFASEAGSGGAEALARQSVSKILSQQLNSLAGDMIKGVELDFDLQSTEDYTSGVKENRTELNVGVSKRLINDRLKVTVGSNFDIEGENQPNRDATNIAGDISADYQLTKDGRYRVRAYRKNEYEVALQGEVVETGLAFIITMDYNRFRELFHRTAEEKEMKKKMRERKKQLREKKKQEAEEKKKKEDALKPVQDEK